MATKEKNEIRLEDQFTIQEPEKKYSSDKWKDGGTICQDEEI